MLLDHISGNAQPSGDFALRQIVEAAHHENLTASRRKALDGLMQEAEPLPGVDLIVRERIGFGRVLGRIAEFKISVLGVAATFMISCEIYRGRLEKSIGLQDRLAFHVPENAKISLLQ